MGPMACGCLLQCIISGNGSCFTVAVMNQYTVPLEWNGECNKLCASEEHNFEFCIMCL